jgi:hypothetical protein
LINSDSKLGSEFICIDKVCTRIILLIVKDSFDYSPEKNLILLETRKVGFEDVIKAVEQGRKLDDLAHTNKAKYPNQRFLVVRINYYAYVVPYVVDKNRKKRFLKTIYPSKKFTKKYFK